ncbi:ABC transporter substrate-binding protein [Phaeobacter gallaeciensis]|uniref:MlaC/ttg2D family ABC transporter substrate-binding protein n=1 Tax=Rhodobacterales TaxID=204455 RepID=UPI00237FF831|nr:ABC transporter substrate-binding protein [Phaeobacter gallaeciensis]MDE4275832.1 ABC transporter substrate-binding protein [Phaeobacter gallaeciensis]MDE4300955.1 ABC transporter substrate-binding protein [Phaeobacter gallaeciensis]MDE5186119.1 ABC transporter substrate-binding protein [Phaeobacter gallaeciensis]
MNRRMFLAAAGAATITAPSALLALNENSASRLIDNLVTDINRVIASGKSENAMYRDFERIFGQYSDTSYIAAYAMGVDARRASAAQKRAFSDAFQGYISRKYGQRFREFIGGRLEVTGVKRVKKWFEVSTTAYLKGQAPFEVTFLVSNRSGKDLFFNMYIEGVNLLLTERTEIGAILDRNRGDIDKMISELKRLS